MSINYNIKGYNGNLITSWRDVGDINFLTSATTIEIISSNENDTVAGTGARKVLIEGINGSYDIVKETIDMNGTSASSVSSNSFLRIYRASVSECGTYGSTNLGTITVRVSGGGASIITIEEDYGESESSLFSVPRNYNFYIKNIKIIVQGHKNISVRLNKRERYDNTASSINPKKVLWHHNDIQTEYSTTFETPICIPEKSDVWISSKIITSTGGVNVFYDGYLELALGDNRINTLSFYSDAFNRIRVSNPLSIFDSKQLHDPNDLYFDEQLISGAGITAVHTEDTASSTISSTNLTAGRFVRQTFRRFNYEPGRSFLVYLTGILAVENPTATGAQRRIGYYDDNNGIFFEQNENGLAVVLRSHVTGTPVDTYYYQSSWDIDKMDGTGPSGVVLDITKIQIFVINFQWLGAGQVMFGFNINDIIYTCHAIRNANIAENVYMSNPNLPIRYELITTASSPAVSLKENSCVVISEGSSESSALVIGYDMGPFVTTAIGNKYIIMALKLQDNHVGDTIKFLSRKTYMLGNNDYGICRIYFNGTPSSSLTYNDVPHSVIQIAEGDGSITHSGGLLIDTSYVANGKNAAVTDISNVETNLFLGHNISNVSDVIYFTFEPVSTNALTLYYAIQWGEFVS